MKFGTLRFVASFAVIPIGVLLLLMLTYALCEANKAYWDYRVRRMCEKDGGVTVYEEV